jgi:hypothetical protein
MEKNCKQGNQDYAATQAGQGPQKTCEQRSGPEQEGENKDVHSRVISLPYSKSIGDGGA